ncbi:hypothetical protein DRN98_03975 [Methanosarcinales archaeon]|nr:MAG: hypothetical protein DRN98_03975 [Methanosarcinales archaeon]
MVNVTALQTKINNKIFTNLGSDLTLTPQAISTIDKWGDATWTTPSGVVVKSVAWLHIKGREDHNPFGDLQSGEVDMAFRHDQTLEIGYMVSLSGDNYLISEIEEFPLANELLVKVARLRKEH